MLLKDLLGEVLDHKHGKKVPYIERAIKIALLWMV